MTNSCPSRERITDEDLLEDSSNNIEDYFRRLGYRDATAPHSREETNDELVITFTLNRGPRYRVSRIEISGNASVPLAEFAPALRLRPDQAFAADRLDADLSTIEDFYRRRGFAAVRADSAVEPSAAASAEIPVAIRILITENVRTVVGSTRVVGNESVPELDLLTGLGLQPDQPFFLTQLAVDRDAIQGRYADLGFQSATIDATGVERRRDARRYRLHVHEGPRLFVVMC